MEGRPTVAEILGAHHAWYHVIDLEPGVSTPGWVDLRPYVDVPRLPADLTGLRAVDLGTFDGFWAFELERRGAVVRALDVDEIPPPDTPEIKRAAMVAEAAGITPGTGFALLKRWFGSSVQRVACPVNSLTPEAVGGPVDLAFLGALLLHLRDPVGALERVRHTLAPGGVLVLFEPVDRRLSKQSEPVARFKAWDTSWTWWYANVACLEAWLRAAGFTDLTRVGEADIRDGAGEPQHAVAIHARV
jgi:SAM-dependent methyltransferase